ncbi:MAG: SGNH/GDSL hydrolase family protein [Planctomycetes bacterium]|nr:SGNH/GDSL hydrolase family protein [Planctomycetota bacterium]MBI3846524.1 SGNH/GDSL hydrolase family protein [Planctomycetota bacterium]
MRIRRIAFRVVTVLAVIMTVLAATEVAFRIFRPQVTQFSGRGLFHGDADVGHRLRPGRSTGTGDAISSAGFRDREFPLEKPAGGIRVMAIGDSFTFGAVAIADVWPKVVEHRLGEMFPGRSVEVIDAGVPCYSTEQELRHFEKFGRRFHPDLVVLGFFVGNDVIENAETRFLRVVDGELVTLQYKPILFDRWLSGSHFYRWIRRSTMTQAKAAGQPGPLLASLARPPYGNAYIDLESDRLKVCEVKPPRAVRDGWERTQSLLRRLRDVLQRDGIEFVVLVIPDEFQVDATLFRSIVDAKGIRAESVDVDLPQRRLREFGARENIEMIDVLPEMRERTEKGERLYIPENTHWNESGNRVGAEALVDPISKRIRRR